jgi:NADH-quinone oxidoreductase subunit N
MSAPFVWIVLPLAVAVLLFFFRYWSRVVALLAAGLTLFLAYAAWQLPIGEPLEVGPLTLKIGDTLSLLGRNFVLQEIDRPLLAGMYLMVSFWLLGSLFARVSHLFVPLALGIFTLLIAALAVEPFLYAALLIEIVVLISVPLLSPPAQLPGQGIFRFFIFQTLGVPFILFVGWMLAGVEASPSDLDLVVRAAVLLALGFSFLLSLFPFHSWIPMLAEEAHPYAAAYIFLMLPGVVALFGLGFLDRYAWLRDSEIVYDLMRVMGVLMVVLGGLWAAFQEHLGRMLGYAVMLETGLTLLAISQEGVVSLEIFFALVAARSTAFIIWGIMLARLRTLCNSDLSFPSVSGLGLRYPLLAAALVLGHLSLSGLPLLAGFPVRLALWNALSPEYTVEGVLMLVGLFGFLVGGLRSLAILFIGVEEDKTTLLEMIDQDESLQADGLVAQAEMPPTAFNSPAWIVFYGFTWVVLFAVGMFPQLFFHLLTDIPAMFTQLIP